MLTLLLVYAPLALSVTAVAYFFVQRLSRRGLGRFPRKPTLFQRTVADLLPAAPVIDDAGLSWRLTTPAGVRISLPFVLPDRAATQRNLDDVIVVDDDGFSTSPAAKSRRSLDGYEPKQFAFVLRWPLPAVRKNPTLPMVFGLPIELVSLLAATEDGRPPVDVPLPAAPPFQVKSASIERILREWPAFDEDLELLARSAPAADFQRAFLLLRDERVWLEQPLWPADAPPPAPFVLNVMLDEAWMLCVLPGHSVSDAVAAPDHVAMTMSIMAGLLPRLAAGLVQAQKEARERVVARRAARRAGPQVSPAELDAQHAAAAARSAAIAAAWLGPSEALKREAAATPPTVRPAPAQPPVVPPAEWPATTEQSQPPEPPVEPPVP